MWRRNRRILGLIGLVVLCAAVGRVCVALGELASVRPVFFLALPLILILGFALVLNPKALVAGIIVLRGVSDPIFQSAGIGSAGGLGGVVNLAIIAIACSFVLRDPARVPRQAWWVWVPFLLAQVIGLMHSPDTFQQLRLFVGLFSTFAMFIVAFYLVDDWCGLDRVLNLILASSVPVVALTLLYIANGISTSGFAGAETVSGRYGGPFPHPNILAFYVVLNLGLMLYAFKRTRAPCGPLKRLAVLAYMLVLLGVLYATKTRSAWLGAALLFAVYGIFFERRYLAYLLIAPALAMLIPEFRDRVLDITQGNQVTQYAKLNSFAWRKLLWTTGLEWMSPTHYLMGYGAGGFREHSVTFFPQAGAINWDAHSVLVQLLFDVGLVGLACYLWLYRSCMRMIWPLLRSDRLLAAIALALLFAYLMISASDNMLAYLVYNWYFWLFMGAVCAVCIRQSGTAANAAPARLPSARRVRQPR